MALQSYVEVIHRGKVMQSDKLANSVKNTFKWISKDILKNVYKRWKTVLQLIVSEKGTNELIERYMGLLPRTCPTFHLYLTLTTRGK